MAKKKKSRGIKIPTINEINARYGQTISMKATQVVDHGLWLPSTFYALNHLTGGGIAYGKILEVHGQESSGKSLVSYNFAYTCQQLGGHVIWVDAEQSWQNSWAEQNGLDIDRVTLISDSQVETISDAIADLAIYWRSKLTNNEPILLVLDSIAAMDCLESINMKMTDGKAEMGGRAKAIYKMFRIRNELLFKLGITQIYVNQLRTSLNTGFGGDPNTTPGGAALKFYASIRLAFFGGKTLTIKHKSKERKVGRYVTVRVIKNKIAPPKATISKAPMYFTDKYGNQIGFDRCFGLDDALIEEGIIEKTSGGVYKIGGETLCRGEEKFRDLLMNNTKVRRKLLKAANINTIAVTRKQLASIKENLFPVDNDVSYESFNESEDEEKDDA